MPTARKHQIDINITPYYHCVSRCVRRAYLCGVDYKTQQNFDHRKQWLVDLLHRLTDIFSIRICAYAIMSNHYHLVLYIDQALAQSWNDHEVISRWATLFPMSEARIWFDLNIDLNNLNARQQKAVALWRDQLQSISWFMRKLNESIARRANKEDECTGRFWEGRFKSQAILDESALLACMAYVDLNPIRAGIYATPEESDFTSIQERLQAYQVGKPTPKTLSGFKDELVPTPDNKTLDHILPCTREEYFELLDTTGRVIRSGKAGAIPTELEPILLRINIKPDTWMDTVQNLGQVFSRFIGRPENIKERMEALNQPRLQGMKPAKMAFVA